MSVTAGTEKDDGGFCQTVRSIAGMFALIFVAFTVLVQPFYIPSGSMKETLLVGDRLLVTKFDYGFSRFSLPFLPPMPLFSGRILASAPARGDIVVFRHSRDPANVLIKRVIGLPGDRIQMVDGVLHINGRAVERERMTDYIDDEDGREQRVKRWRETLPNGVSYTTLDLVEGSLLDDTRIYDVPSDHYFMMGDNRDDSADSRMLSELGYVPFENIVGRARIVFLSFGNGTQPWEIWRWPSAMRWSRLLTLVH
jgi:signal peptidase I